MSKSMIIILGIELVKHVDISLMASVGILKYAIHKNYKPNEKLDLEKIRHVLKTSLSKQLKKLNVSNVEEIISNLESVAIKNQSIITMEMI